LTRGGPGGTPRPIEMHSHDPIRYCSDMLAWMHQCVASEREQFVILLSPTDPSNPQRRVRPNAAALSAESLKILHSTLDHTIEGTTRPLKVRVEQVLVSSPEVVVCYKLTSLLQFYGNTISGLMMPDKALPTLLDELSKMALRVFLNQLNVRANNLLANVELPPDDLSAPSDLEDALELLKNILSCKDTYMDSLGEQTEELKQIFNCILDPMVQMCTISASSLPPIRMAVYTLNCIYRIYTILSVYDNTEHWTDSLSQQSSSYIDTLVAEQARALLIKSGLRSAITLMQTWETEDTAARAPLSQTTGLDPETLRDAMGVFDRFLGMAEFGLSEEGEMLQSTKARASVQHGAVEYFIGLYSRLHGYVSAPEQGYRSAEQLMPRTPEQIKQLLS